MDNHFQNTLLDLFQQVSNHPDSMPEIAVDAWPEGSVEWQLLTSFRNVLESLQQSRQDVLKSEERFSLAIQGANDGLWDWDLRNDAVYFSPRWKSMLGYEDDEIPHHFNEWLKRVHPEDRERAQQTIQDYLNGRTASYRLEHRLQHKDGTYRWILARGVLQRDKDGKPYRMAGSHTDITERKQAEEQLREKEAQYRSIFEASTDVLLIVDLEDGRIVEANPAACKVYRYTYEEIIGLPHSATIHPKDRPYVANHVIPLIKSGGKYFARGIGLRKDGTTFHLDVHNTAFTFQHKTHLLVVIRDVTEQVEAEEQLREKEAQYRSIFEATSDGLLINDLEDGHTVEANPAECRMHGCTYEELLSMPLAELIHPDYHTLFQDYIETVKAGKSFQGRAVDLRKDGTAYPVDVRGTTFMYKGKPHALSVIRDITEQTRAEEQLREKEQQYRSIFEATLDAVFISDLDDGHVIEANPAACKIYGYSYDEFIGLLPSAIIHPDRLQFFLEKALPSVKKGGEWHTRGVNLRKDGTAFPVDVHETAFTFQGIPRMLAVIRDITEQVKAEEQLREKEAQYRSIFEAGTDGLVINDLENGNLVEVNPAMCKMHGYTYEEFMQLHPMNFIHPNSHGLFAEYLETVKAGKKFQTRAIDLRKNGTSFPVEVHGTTFEYKGKPHVLAVVRDITEQVQAEEQVREKEEQYRSIFEASTDGLFIFSLESGLLVEANPAGAMMHGFSYEEFLDLSRPTDFIHTDARATFSRFLQTIKMGGLFQDQAVALRKDGTEFPIEVRGIPITYRGKVHGLAVVRDITEQVQAYELLEQRVEERTRELTTLLEISHNVASYIELKPLLATVLDQLKMIADYTGSSFSILEGDDFVLVENRGPAPLDQALQLHIPIKKMGRIWDMFSRREPVIIPDTLEDTPLTEAFRTMLDTHMDATFGYIRSWLAVPLSHKEQIIGMLTLSSSEPDYYTPRLASLAVAIANQAAVALANAQLYERAQELAALEERQRLARELHDSVSQALYGITLGTHTARTLLQRDPSKVAEPLDYVLSQAEAALTEMRALIFELRPESLETEGLAAALSRQVAALNARHEIVVRAELCDEPDLPLKTKEELYRVVQEALHNTVKHARARNVNVRMCQDADGLQLEVCDDGIGFDPSQPYPGHLGLRSMRERLNRLGGTLRIESAPGEGTCIQVQLAVPARR